jgi:hypothetical protein
MNMENMATYTIDILTGEITGEALEITPVPGRKTTFSVALAEDGEPANPVETVGVTATFFDEYGTAIFSAPSFFSAEDELYCFVLSGSSFVPWRDVPMTFVLNVNGLHSCVSDAVAARVGPDSGGVAPDGNWPVVPRDGTTAGKVFVETDNTLTPTPASQ